MDNVSEVTPVVFDAFELSKLIESKDIQVPSNLTKLVSSLKEKCILKDVSTATSALHAITYLIERGDLPLTHGLATLLSLTASTKEVIPGLVPAICHLLLIDAAKSNRDNPYNIHNRPHPLIIILKQSWEYWESVYCFLHNVFNNHYDLDELKYVEETKDIISYVLFDPTAPYSAKSEVVRLLIRTGFEKFMLKLFAWQTVDQTWCRLVRDIAIESSNDSCDFLSAMTCLISSAAVWHCSNGYDPLPYISLLNRYIESSPAAHDVVLFQIAQIISVCPTFYLHQIADVCSIVILKKQCSKLTASCVVAFFLNWAISSSALTRDITNITQTLMDGLESLPAKSDIELLLRNDIFLQLMNSNPVVKFSLELALLANHLQERPQTLLWLKEVSAIQIGNLNAKGILPILLGLLLNSNSPDVIKSTLKLLTAICAKWNNLSFGVLCVILHKLSCESDPYLQLEFLNYLPAMAVSKGNVPLVLGTIQFLGDNDIMAPMRLKLLLKLWENQPRTFPFLHKLLTSTKLQGKLAPEMHITRASVLLQICQKNPQVYGKDVVGFLSDVLNASDGADDPCAPSMAIDAIALLCRANVIHVKGTWDTLGPKIRKDTRPSVVAAVSRLLSEAAVVGKHEEDLSLSWAIAALWNLVGLNCGVVEPFVALAQFPLDAFELKTFPHRFRENLEIPKELKTSADEQLPLELIISYVPGECWVQLLAKIEDNMVYAAEDLIKALLKKEIAALPRGLYSLPLGVGEPRNLSHLPPNSILRALIHTLQKLFDGKHHSQRLCQSILRILECDYLRPIPPCDWTFLQSGISDKDIACHIFKLCALQGAKSPTAKKVLQESIGKINLDDKDTAKDLLHILPGLSQCLPPVTVMSFLGDVLQSLLNHRTLFAEAMVEVRRAVALATIGDANRTAIGKAVNDLIADLPSELEDVDELWDCVADLPNAIVDRIANPKEWAQVTSRRIKHALNVRKAAALNTKGSDLPIDFFSDLLDTVCSRPEDQPEVVDVLTRVLKKSSPSGCAGSFRQLIARILASISDSSENEAKECIFLIDVLMIVSAVISSCCLLVSDPENLAKDKSTLLRLFPSCVHSLFAFGDKDWLRVLPHVVEGLHRIAKWGPLPDDYRVAVNNSVLALRNESYCLAPERWPRLFERSAS